MLSDDKIIHMSHVLFREWQKRGVVDFLEDEGKIRRQIRRSIMDELKIADEIDKAVRKKLESYSKKLIEGTPEWDVLYKKFFQEEEKRRGRDL
ncbi:MAG: DUF507 family protein [Nitrospirae bacterium]|nr:DUF507 family protein [Nitrospirota bacterium]